MHCLLRHRYAGRKPISNIQFASIRTTHFYPDPIGSGLTSPRLKRKVRDGWIRKPDLPARLPFWVGGGALRTDTQSIGIEARHRRPATDPEHTQTHLGTPTHRRMNLTVPPTYIVFVLDEDGRSSSRARSSLRLATCERLWPSMALERRAPGSDARLPSTWDNRPPGA